MGGHAWGPCCIGRRVRSGCSPAWTALSPPFSGNSPGTMMSLPSGWTLLLLGTLVLMLLPGGALSYCVDPPDIPNAVRKTNVGTLIPPGMVIRYGCRPGYKLIPGRRQGHVTCLQNLTWSSAPNFCQKVRCPAPDVNNGTPKPMPRPGEETYAFEDRVTIKCDLGYDIKDSINGNAQIHCKHDGTWDPAVPVCEPACEPPARISNGRDDRGWKNDFLVGSSVSYSCNRGWSLVGVSSIQCTAGDGGTPRWDAPAPECKACEPPARISNGRDDRGWEKAFPVGSRVSYSCNRDWSLVGVSSILCIAGDGGTPRWNASAPECKGSVLNTTDNSAEPQGEDIITQDKPTTVPPKGAEVAGTSSGSAMNIAGNFAEPDGEGRVIVLAIGIVTGIGIVVLGVVPAIIASAILKKNRIKVDAS
ncbi:C4b-binding protein alpha chain-like isoform X7 [Mauremys reevesii]|uniref:C4b-binding protein alpha chain-like isoform X7 n=1 Tax=Mauremys reevesii TaxID=260615 RepID=UPI00193F54E2|nr:C4b-binding protein alpha chain-like isoform X7 [Mauremys reevesii]